MSLSAASACSAYQLGIDDYPEGDWLDDKIARRFKESTELMQQDFLGRCSLELRTVLRPVVSQLEHGEMLLLTGDALTTSQKADMMTYFEAAKDSLAVTLLQQELKRWVAKALFQERVLKAERLQDQLQQERKAARPKSKTQQQTMLDEVSNWRPDSAGAQSSAWELVFEEREQVSQVYLEQHSRRHTSHTDIFRSFLMAGRWAGFPYWMHPEANPQSSAVPLGEQSSCGACCRALGIHKSEAVLQQRSTFGSIFGSCFGFGHSGPCGMATSSSNTTRNPSMAARLSMIAGQGQNWESDFSDPARVFAQQAVQETFAARAQLSKQPTLNESEHGSLPQHTLSSRTCTRRGSSIYWEPYSLSAKAQGQPGTALAQRARGIQQHTPISRLIKLLSGKGSS